MESVIQNPYELMLDRLSEIHRLVIDIKHKPAKEPIEPLQERFVNKVTITNIWDCSMSTVDRAIRDGLIKRYYLGGSVRFKLSEVMEALEKEK